MATSKAYNVTDTANRLVFVERADGEFGGYAQDLLVDKLTQLEIEDYVCTVCKGVMVNACQMGEEQTPVCEGCTEKSDGVLPTLKTRKRIPSLKSKCPLYTRGCVWRGKLEEVEAHHKECPEFIIACPNNCEELIKRCELGCHLSQCVMRIIQCEYCTEDIVFQDLTPHHGECLQFPLECPNECLLTLKRRDIQTHILEDCPDTIVECPYKKFGCEDGMKRSELCQHVNDNKYKHLDLKSDFALAQLDKVEQAERLTTKLEMQQINQTTKQKEFEKRLKKRDEEIVELRNKLTEQQNNLQIQSNKQKELEETLNRCIREIIKCSTMIKPRPSFDESIDRRIDRHLSSGLLRSERFGSTKTKKEQNS